MHPNIVARMGIKVVKASAYQSHGLMMAKKIVKMVQMKKVGVNFDCRTRAIITRVLCMFYPLYEVHLCTVTLGLMYS